MNLKLVLHLFRSDWLRLRWFVIAGWAAMIIAAYPWLSYSPADFRTPFGVWSHGGSYGEDLRQAVGEIMRPSVAPAFVRRVIWLLPQLLLGISASLGYHSAAWARVRPVRAVERVAAGTISVLSFIVLPQLAIIGLNLRLHELGSGEIVAGLVRAGRNLLLLHGCSILLGRMCGSFWRWMALIFGLSLLSGVIGMLRFSYNPYMAGLFRPSAWGENAYEWWPLLLVLAGLLLIGLLFRGGRKPKLKMALVVILIFVVPRNSLRWRPSSGSLVLRNVPEHPYASSIRPELLTPARLHLERTIDEDGPRAEAGAYVAIRTPELPKDEGIFWMVERSGALLAKGKRLDQFVPQRIPPGKNVVPGQLHARLEDLAPLPFRNENWKASNERLSIGNINAKEIESAGDKLTLDADLLGITFRYRVLADQALEDKMVLKGEDFRGHARLIRTGPLANSIDLIFLHGSARLLDEAAAGIDPFSKLRCFVRLPSEDLTVETRQLVYSSGPLLSQATGTRRILRLGDKTEDISKLDLKGARIILLAPEISGSVRTRLKQDLQAPAQAGARDDDGLIGWPRDDAWADERRPAPESCTEDQAGHWMMQTLRKHDRAMAGVELAPYVARNPRVFFGLRESWGYHQGHTLTLALEGGLPEQRKEMLLQAYRDADEQGVQTLLPVIAQRGWLAEVKEDVRRQLQSLPGASSILIAAAASYEDPSFYDGIIGRTGRGMTLRNYRSIRLLPGIGPRLGEAIRADFNTIKDNAEAQSRHERLQIGAAHGIPEAFSILYGSAKQVVDSERWTHERLMPVIAALPGESSRERWNELIRKHEAADFRHDEFLNAWVLKSPTP